MTLLHGNRVKKEGAGPLFGINRQGFPGDDRFAAERNLKLSRGMNNTKKRIKWLDICKGIAIILVILGHIYSIPKLLSEVIFSFHMPLFMIVNGYLLHSYNVRETLTKSSRSLLKPYAVVCLLEAVLAAWMMPDIDSAGQVLYTSLNDMVVGMSRTSEILTQYQSVWLIWFVACLFVARNLYVMIMAAGSRLPYALRMVTVLAAACAGVYISRNIGFLPWSADVAMASVVFIAFGDFLRTRKFSSRTQTACVAVSLAVWIFLLMHGCQLELAVRSYPHGALSFICAIAGSIVMMALSKGIENVPLLSPFLVRTGGRSLIILAVHTLEMRFINWDAWVYGPLGIEPGWVVQFVIRCAFILAVTEVFCYIREGLKKARLREQESGMMQSDPKRLPWPDIAKGICMISIILGHMGIAWIDRIVFVYHIPVFFLIAGYFFRKKNNAVFLRSKARRLLVPYAVSCMVICVCAVIKAYINGGSKRAALAKKLFASFYGAGDNWKEPFNIPGIGAVWFLLALFFALLILNFLAERKYYRTAIIAAGFAGWASFRYTGVWLPWSIQAGMLASMYLLAGYEWRKSGRSVREAGAVYMIVLSLAAAAEIQNFKGLWLVHDYFGNGWIDFPASIAASAVIIRLAMYVGDKGYLTRRVLEFFGRNSLLVLCVHFVELEGFHLNGLSDTMAAWMHLNPNHSVVLLALLKIVYSAAAAAILSRLLTAHANRKKLAAGK